MRQRLFVPVTGAVAATALLVACGKEPAAPGSTVVSATPPRTDAVQAAPAFWAPARPALSVPPKDPFAPVVAAAATAPPPLLLVEAPRAAPPPLPFVFLGRLRGADLNAVFVRHDERVLLLAEGGELEAGYRVEQIGEAEVAFTWLATGERQVMALR